MSRVINEAFGYPKVSVIIPVYNAEPWLRRCMDSVLEELEDIASEVICVDDGSTDGSAKILSEYKLRDRRVRVVFQRNAGRSAARNTGMDFAQGKWVTFADADDYFTPGGLRSMVRKAEGRDAEVVYGVSRESTGDKGAITPFEKASLEVDAFRAQQLLLDFAYYVYEKPKPEEHAVLTEYGQIDLCTMWGSLYLGDVIRKQKVRCCEGLKFGEDTLFNFDFLKYAHKALYVGDVTYVQNVENAGTIRTYHPGDAERAGRLIPLWRWRVPNGDFLEPDVASVLAREVMSIASRLPFRWTFLTEGRELASTFANEWGSAIDIDRVGRSSSPYWPYWRLQYGLVKRGGPYIFIILLAKMYGALKKLFGN